MNLWIPSQYGDLVHINTYLEVISCFTEVGVNCTVETISFALLQNILIQLV